MSADPADATDPTLDQDDAQPGAQDENQTHGDPAAARQPEGGDKPTDGGDDSDQSSDPLVLAQMEPETKAAADPELPAEPEPPKPTTPKKTTATPPKAGAKQDPPKAKADQAKPAEEPQPEDDADEAEALADIPPEDWKNGVLSHKAKSQFLAQRKTIRAHGERLKAEAAARKTADERYGAVEKFVREQGLGDEEYVSTVTMGGAIKRNDPRVIPVLERTLQQLRKATGQPEPTAPEASAPAEPQLDADLAAVLEEAEGLGVDTAKVRSRFKAPVAAPAPAAPAAKAPAKPQQPAQPAPPAASASGGQAADAEMVAIIDALQGLGVADPVAHVSELLKANPDLGKTQPGTRLKATLAAHSAAASKAQPVQRQQTTAPLSGRRGPPVQGAGGRFAQPTTDPLKLALAPARGR